MTVALGILLMVMAIRQALKLYRHDLSALSIEEFTHLRMCGMTFLVGLLALSVGAWEFARV